MTNEELKRSKTRNPYQKPQINRVKLVLEEAVLVDCKTDGSAGPVPESNPCTLFTGPCRDAAS